VTFRAPARASLAGAALLSAMALAACGESREEKAKAEVCAARKEIANQITALQGLTISANVVNEAKAHVETIGKELTKIKNAQPKLEGTRKEQVETASKTFEGELSSIAASVQSSVPSGNLESALKSAGPKIKSALETLASDYRQALGPISC
jgi:hypothetical protein